MTEPEQTRPLQAEIAGIRAVFPFLTVHIYADGPSDPIWTLALFLKHMQKLPPAAEQAWQQVRN